MTDLDIETRGMMDYASKVSPGEALSVHIESKIRDRCEAIRAGLLIPSNQMINALKSVDPLLRPRYDFNMRTMVVERNIAEFGGWTTILMWPDDNNGRPFPVEVVVDMLRENDMQRFDSPAAYLEYKHAKARARQLLHENASNELVRAAVDSLSRKQIEEFIAVERAMATGETIVCHGPMEKWMTRIYNETVKALYEQECQEIDNRR